MKSELKRLIQRALVQTKLFAYSTQISVGQSLFLTKRKRKPLSVKWTQTLPDITVMKLQSVNCMTMTASWLKRPT